MYFIFQKFMKKFFLFYAVIGSLLITGCTTPPSPTVVTNSETPPQKDTKVSIEIVDENADVEDTSAINSNLVDGTKERATDDEIKSADDDIPVYLDYSESEYLALKGKEPFVLFFHANWCPICRRMEKDISADLENYPKGTKFLKADFDTETELKKEYGIKIQSTVVVLDESGEAIYTAQDPALDDLKAAIEKSVADDV